MRRIQVGIIGTGWCDNIRTQIWAAHPRVHDLHLAEVRPDRLAEVARATDARGLLAEGQAVVFLAARMVKCVR